MWWIFPAPERTDFLRSTPLVGALLFVPHENGFRGKMRKFDNFLLW
jgi:hypothetical protein